LPFGNVPAVDVEIAFTGVPVSALDAGRDFFERLFGRPADVDVAADEVMWCLSERAWLYVVVDPARAGRSLVSLSVADLDAAVGELASRGVVPVSTEVVGDAGRKATVLDPDGNSVALLEVRAEV
jgi:predicted enzyme related to lactoylglutathione lyase